MRGWNRDGNRQGRSQQLQEPPLLCFYLLEGVVSSSPAFPRGQKKSAVKVNKLEEIDIKNFNFLEKASKGKNKLRKYFSKTWKTDIMTIKEREGSVCTKCLAKLECS